MSPVTSPGEGEAPRFRRCTWGKSEQKAEAVLGQRSGEPGLLLGKKYPTWNGSDMAGYPFSSPQCLTSTSTSTLEDGEGGGLLGCTPKVLLSTPLWESRQGTKALL